MLESQLSGGDLCMSMCILSCLMLLSGQRGPICVCTRDSLHTRLFPSFYPVLLAYTLHESFIAAHDGCGTGRDSRQILFNTQQLCRAAPAGHGLAPRRERETVRRAEAVVSY